MPDNGTKQQIEFDQWLNRVDDECRKVLGLSIHDLPDETWRDWYDAGYTAHEALVEAGENQGFDDLLGDE